MMEVDEPDFLSVMDSQYDNLYDYFDFFQAQALPVTNADDHYRLRDIYNSQWQPSRQPTSAGSTGEAPTSQGSFYGPRRNAVLAVESLADIFLPNPHPKARKEVTVATLFDDRRIKEGLALFSKLDPSAEHRVRPKFRPDIPAGGEGLWSVLECLCCEIDQRLAVDYTQGIFSRPSTLITTVITLLGNNLAFQALYRKHTKSPLALLLANNSEVPDIYGAYIVYAADNIIGWNFSEPASKTDPVMRVLRKDLTSFARHRRFSIISHMRSSVPRIMYERETIGLKLLPSGVGWDGPKTRAAQAEKIHGRIYPNFRGISAGKAQKDRALVALYSCASTMAAANDLVHTVGHVNIALGSFRTANDFAVPWEVIPLAATLVDMEVQVVRSCGKHPSAAREGAFDVFSSFSRTERTRFKYHHKEFKRLRGLSQYKNILDKVVRSLNEAQDLNIVAHRLVSKAIPANRNPVS